MVEYDDIRDVEIRPFIVNLVHMDGTKERLGGKMLHPMVEIIRASTREDYGSISVENEVGGCHIAPKYDDVVMVVEETDEGARILRLEPIWKV